MYKLQRGDAQAMVVTDTHATVLYFEGLCSGMHYALPTADGRSRPSSGETNPRLVLQEVSETVRETWKPKIPLCISVRGERVSPDPIGVGKFVYMGIVRDESESTGWGGRKGKLVVDPADGGYRVTGHQTIARERYDRLLEKLDATRQSIVEQRASAEAMAKALPRGVSLESIVNLETTCDSP